MDTVKLRIEEIYVPAKRRSEIDSQKVEALAESILDKGLEVPISVRQDGDRLVLVSGLLRLEACRALGEDEIDGVVVGTKRF